MLQKLYKSLVAFLTIFGAVCFLVNIAVAIHDSIEYRELPIEYRQAIERLEDGWLYEGLSNEQQGTILAVHKKWVSEGRLPWWADSLPVEPERQKNEILNNFEKFDVRWGSKFHQRHPVWAILLSVSGFVPLLVFVGVVWWVTWLRTA